MSADAAELAFRPLAASDLPLLAHWLRHPHVDRWWHGPQDMPAVRAKYLPRIDGTEPTHVFVFDLGAVPVGWIQWARWADYPQHAVQLGAALDMAGLDLAIGELELLGRGLGPRVIRAFLERIVFADPAIAGCVTDPQSANQRSLRAFEKAGFTRGAVVQLQGEPYTREVVRRDRPR